MKNVGRPRVSEDKVKKGIELRNQGMSWRKIGKELGISDGIIRLRLKTADRRVKTV